LMIPYSYMWSNNFSLS